jgi:phosphoribosylaminoimidazolecarboxamide formyltransferase/IMP cyclohydrolase
LRNLRLLESEGGDARRRERDAHRVLGGMLIRTATRVRGSRDDGGRGRAAPTEREWGDLLFAWRVVKHVRSNAIVIAATRRRSASARADVRVDSTRLALGKALSPWPVRCSHPTRSSVRRWRQAALDAGCA